MTLYECFRVLAEPALPVLHAKVRNLAVRFARNSVGRECEVLDVGGRMSPYTVGAYARVTVLDVPPDTVVRRQLLLGLDADRIRTLRRRRSNVVRVLVEDMTRCSLPDRSFDGVTTVEVIEHVVEDEAFVAQIARVLRPDGWLILTTPNGDYIRNIPPDFNPDHVRHYSRAHLAALLTRYFNSVDVRYAVKTGRYRYWGLPSMSVRYPGKLIKGIFGNLMNHLESRGLDEQPRRTAHLIAVARGPRIQLD